MAGEGRVRAALYARVSTMDRDQDPETQLMALRDYAAAHDLEVTGTYVDRASATDLRGRVSWRRLLDEAQAGACQVIVVWKLDRAFRSVLHAAQTLDTLRRAGVGLRSVTEPWVDTTSASGELIFHLLATFAQFERALISERVKAGMDRARRQGKHIGRPKTPNRPRKRPDGWLHLQAQILAGDLSRRQAARALGVSRTSVQRYLRAG